MGNNPEVYVSKRLITAIVMFFQPRVVIQRRTVGQRSQIKMQILGKRPFFITSFYLKLRCPLPKRKAKDIQGYFFICCCCCFALSCSIFFWLQRAIKFNHVFIVLYIFCILIRDRFGYLRLSSEDSLSQ